MGSRRCLARSGQREWTPMSPHSTARPLVACALLGLVVALPAQQRPTFRAGVDLVQVDVVVVEPDGQPVRGLSPADFLIIDRGVEREVATFAEVAHDAPPAPAYPPGVTADVADNQSAASERLVMIVVDDLNFRDRTEEAKALARRVVSELGAGVSLGMVTTTGRYGVEITEDRERVLREIDRFEDTYDRGRIAGELRPPNIVSGSEILGGYFNAPRDLGRFFGSISSFTVVEDLARVMGADDGRRKAIVWVSAGVENAHGAMEKLLAGVECAESVYWDRSDPENPKAVSLGTFSPQLAFFCDSIEGMLDDLRRASITTYTVDPGGPREGATPLDLIAAETGGFAVRASDLGTGLGRVIADLDHYYLLGFYPPALEGTDYRAIEVRVNRPGVVVRHRRGYSPEGPRDPPPNDSPLGDLVAGLMPNPDLPLRLLAVPLLTESPRAQVALTLEVDLEPFPRLDDEATFDDTIEYGVFVADLERKRVTDSRTRTLELSWTPAERARPGAHRFRAGNVIDLAPGRYQLRASAISSGLGRRGSVYLLLDVPDFARTPIAIGGVALSVAGREDDHPKVVDSVVRPDWPLPFRPTLERAFAPGDTLRVFFQVRRQPGEHMVTGSVSLVNMDGKPAAPVPFEAGRERLSRLDLRLPLAGVPPGGYALVVTATDGAASAERRVGILVSAVR